MTPAPATERLAPRQDAESTDVIGHLNLARDFRGGERQTELLVRGLAEWGLHQRVIARRDEPLAARLRNVPNVEIRQTGAGLWSAARACRGCRLVHVHDGRSVHAASLARDLYGVAYLVTRRVDNPIRSNWLTRRAYRRAARTVAVSRAIASQIAALDAELDAAVVPDAASAYPSHAQNVARLRAKYGDRFLVGHVGALDDSHKGQRDLFAAARELRLTHPQMCFLLLGGGRDAEAFARETADLDNVELIGHVDNVGDYLALFDAFVFPSRHEGLGSTLLDAMDYALPIVATAVGGIVELIKDGRNGLLVQPGNVDQLRYALTRLHDDPALAQRLGHSGREFVQAYSPARMVERYLELYQPLIGTDAALERL